MSRAESLAADVLTVRVLPNLAKPVLALKGIYFFAFSQIKKGTHLVLNFPIQQFILQHVELFFDFIWV